MPITEHLDKTKPNPAVIKEYRARETEWGHRAEAFTQATADRDAQKALYDKLCKDRHDKFMEGFNDISNKLKEMYQVRPVPPRPVCSIV